MVVKLHSLVYSNYMRVLKPANWLFNPNSPGKIRLFDGRTGQCFKQPVTVGCSYFKTSSPSRRKNSCAQQGLTL
jgi:hypothetical protein